MLNPIHRHRWTTVALAALILGLVLAVAGATGSPTLALAQPNKPNDPIAKRVFPPDLVMQHQGEIGLTEPQRKELTTLIQTFQAGAVKLQMELSREAEALTHLLEDAKPNEARVLEQASTVMTLEKKVKLHHLTLLVRIKNLLTAEQQKRLNTLRTTTP